MTDHGGPAFPTNESNFYTWCDTGMTLRDYFMAHAPTKQYWFKPTMATPCPVHRFVSDDGIDYGQDNWAAEKAEGDNFMDKNGSAIDAWQAEYEKQTCVQWPAAWADEMLKARQA
jgi:hypothetical protein